LAERLRAQAGEINQAILDRLHAMDEENPVRELDYLQGLNEAVYRGVEYGIEVIAVGEDRAAPMPLPLLMQARLAARHRIPLERVLRRYLAAKMVLHEFVLSEATAMATLETALLGSVLTAQETAFDRLVATASGEYRRETTVPNSSQEGRRLEQIQRFLDGEPVDPSSLEYELSGHHLGIVARSSVVRPLLRQLSVENDARFLAVRPTDDETWAWISGRRPLDVNLIGKWTARNWPDSTPLGIGEPGEGLSGWRRSHEQARAAVSLAQPGSGGAVRYRDIALIAAAAKDPLLLASLREMYLAPLGEKGGRGTLLRETLRAYFAADGNSSSAAAALGVSRQTVSNRLQTVEKCLDHPLGQCADALFAALRLEELGRLSNLHDSLS